MRAFLERSALFAGLWLVLTGGAGKPHLALVAILAGAIVSLRMLPRGGRRPAPVATARFLAGFLGRSVAGGVDVAWRALHPRMPLAPGWRVLPTGLPDGGARVAFETELSLLPGTLSAGSEGDAILVHCLDVRGDVCGAARAEEARLAAALRADGERRA
ncbi:Na+/H+ antiporter subunit E [Salinarimonas sp.]|uniref:Na+/H+ antiporter subunit E n=1 Tax=Salinarimonas sp. TaxID=2766526 RepID=UPI0032D925F5